MQKQEYCFDVVPKPAPRLVYSDKWSKRPTATKYYNYKNTLIFLAKLNRFVLQPEMELIFEMPIPKGGSKKQQEEYRQRLGTPHQQKPDIDNLIKGFMDAMAKEDSHVWNISARKVWAKDGKIKVIA